MAMGIHSFYAYKRRNTNYFLGSFEGDEYNDESFAEKLQRITDKVASIYGFGNFSYWWSPSVEKPYKPLSNDQKYKRAVTKASNQHKKRVTEIINENSLFVDDLLMQETERHYLRIEELKKRYEQNT